MNTDPKVTLVVVPRERFSFARESLESIYEHTKEPFRLVYVDGGSPRYLATYLKEKSAEKSFELIRKDCYLSPNRARNIGLERVKTPYVVFIDNDVVVSPNWLKPLIDCAEETGAAIINPLTCHGKQLHTIIHCAGGRADIDEVQDNGTSKRHIVDDIFFQGRKVDETGVKEELYMKPTDSAEFHCVMVRTDIFDKIGPMDEKLLNTKEHVDLCIRVRNAGGTIYLEPKSVVTYVPGLPIEWSDMPFYMLRWSNAWERSSLERLKEKWNLTDDDYFKRRIRRLGWRRRMTITDPLSQKLCFGKRVRPVQLALAGVDLIVNHVVTANYKLRHERKAA